MMNTKEINKLLEKSKRNSNNELIDYVNELLENKKN